jgi:hypothetical protein
MLILNLSDGRSNTNTSNPSSHETPHSWWMDLGSSTMGSLWKSLMLNIPSWRAIRTLIHTKSTKCIWTSAGVQAPHSDVHGSCRRALWPRAAQLLVLNTPSTQGEMSRRLGADGLLEAKLNLLFDLPTLCPCYLCMLTFVWLWTDISGLNL